MAVQLDAILLVVFQELLVAGGGERADRVLLLDRVLQHGVDVIAVLIADVVFPSGVEGGVQAQEQDTGIYDEYREY